MKSECAHLNNCERKDIQSEYNIISLSFSLSLCIQSLDPNSNVAPPDTPSTAAGGYTITSARLAELRSNFMYWFYDRDQYGGNGDYQKDIHASMTQLHKNLNFQLPFYGFRFNYTRVSWLSLDIDIILYIYLYIYFSRLFSCRLMVIWSSLTHRNISHTRWCFPSRTGPPSVIPHLWASSSANAVLGASILPIWTSAHRVSTSGTLD